VQKRSTKSRIKIALPACLLVTMVGCKAGHPNNAQAASMNWIKHHVTVGGKNDRNPLQSSPQTIEAGKQAFAAYCVSCHGRDGQNTGVPFAASIDPPIPLLTSRDVQSYSDGQLKRVIEAGLSPSGMPASKGILSDEEMWQIVIYIRHLPPAGSLGDPKAYGGDEYGATCECSPESKAH
jgi:mono/diheme cytochrome c family protein